MTRAGFHALHRGATTGLTICALLWTGCTRPDGTLASKGAQNPSPPAAPKVRLRPMATMAAMPAARSEMRVAKAPPPYPAEWIRQARSKNRGKSCKHLIYKKGCSQIRTGRIKVRVTLGADGKVRTVQPVSNAVRLDPKRVMKCVLKEVPGWTFHPPKDVQPSFVLELLFADKC